MATQVSEINETNRCDAVVLNPPEDRLEVRTSTALGLQSNRFRRSKLLRRLNRSVAKDNMDRLWLGLIGDRRNFAGELLELFFANRTGGIYPDDNGPEPRTFD